MTMNFIKENMNPNNDNIGDCVLRAIARLEKDNMTYDEVLNRLKELNPNEFSKMEDAYKIPLVYETILEELGYIRFKTNVDFIKTRYRITSVNMASLFAKDFGTDVLALTNNHAVAALSDGSFSDTWNSGRKRVIEFFIKDNDGILEEIMSENNVRTIINGKKITYLDTWFERLPNRTINLYYKKEIIAKFKDGERIS